MGWGIGLMDARRSMHAKICCAIFAASLSGCSAQQITTGQFGSATTADQYEQEAFRLAGDDYFKTTAQLQCRRSDAALAFVRDESIIPATRIFDNLVYLGKTGVGAYALLTSDGIILIDTLNSTDDVKNVIEPGLRELGLDPASIKTVIITQAHGDHYGGAVYLSETYGARIMMSDADWNLLENPPAGNPFADRSRFGTAPSRDLTLQDHQKVTLGDTSVTVVLTPGHSPATASLLFPVFNNGSRHMAGMWGGTGIPRDTAAMREYIASAAKFLKISKENKADVEVNTHAFVDDALRRMSDIREKPDQPNPFIIGTKRYEKYTRILELCAKAVLARGQ